MANPPITIGSFANVPAPGSPISSPWAQDVTRRVIHQFATVAAMKASNLGEGAWAAVSNQQGRLYSKIGSDWVTTFTTFTTQTVDAFGYVNFNVSAFGIAIATHAVVTAPRGAGDPGVFLIGAVLTGGGATINVRVFFINSSLAIAQAGNGTVISFWLTLIGAA